VEIGRQSLPEEFVMGEDRLVWGWLENRPFLRACQGLGLALFDTGRIEAAHLIFNQLLAMNPNDEQGVRASAIESAFALSRPREVLRICNKYRGDCLADSLYGRPLAFFQLGREVQAEKALISAIALLPLIARELLKKRHRVPKAMSDGYITMGGPDEAYEYWQRLGKEWKETEGALAFLAGVLSRYQVRPSIKKH
jgi:tetratricopeptide (TPR) repeat protein